MNGRAPTCESGVGRLPRRWSARLKPGPDATVTTRPGWRAVLVSVGLLACVACAKGAPPTSPPPTTSIPTTTTAPSTLYRSACAHQITPGRAIPVQSSQVTEASGIEASRRRPGWFWVHNDSGDVPRFFGVGPSGQVQVVRVTGARAIDWEDIAADHTTVGDGLWLADIGDNLGVRPNVVLYRVPEPAAATSSVAAASLTLEYPDGPHNAEALLRDPATGTLIILTKEPGLSRMYTFVPPATGGGSGRLQGVGRFRVGVTPGALVTAADVSPDRSTIAVRTYGEVWLYQVRQGQSLPDALRSAPCQAPHAAEVQGEGIGFLLDSHGYATISEGRLPRIFPFRETLR